MSEKLNNFTNTTNLNFNVGDYVVVELGDMNADVDVVTKVLPNGRFMLRRYGNCYWRADGTRNTHALKGEKNQKVRKVDCDFEIACCYYELTAERLKDMAEIFAQTPLDDTLEITTKVKMLNKFLDFLGFERKDYFKSDLEVD